MAKQQTPNRLVLIDANSLLHRAFHALPPLTTPSGKLIGAVYGFSSMLLKVIDELKPEYMAVAWDTKAPTFRHKMFDGYKGNRKETPDEFIQQLKPTKTVIEAFDIPQFAQEGFEADDLIGTLAALTNTEASELEVVVVTGDMDMLQLVNEQTKVFAPRKSFSDTVLYGIDEVKEKLSGLRPDQVVEYKALRGDPSDNIPGVKGVGEKTATTLLNKYQTLENVYQHLEELTNRQQNLLSSEQETAFMSRDLAQIVKDAPLEFDLEKMFFHSLDPDRVRALFMEYGFKSLVSKIPDGNGSQSSAKSLEEINFSDYEKVNPEEFDILIAAHLINGELGSVLELPSLVLQYLGYSIEQEELDDEKIDCFTYHLKLALEKELDQPGNGQIRTLFYELEMPLRRVIKKMEEMGVAVDQELMKEMGTTFSTRIQELETAAYEQIGHEVNLNSPKQLAEVLFDELKLPVLKKTKTQRSTNEAVLQQLKGMHPFIETLLEYREVTKLNSTYIEPLPDFIDGIGRIHTTYNQTKVASGRLSSENPNLQNIPTDPEYGMRRLFIPSDGMKLIAADYSQFELRIMAHITDDDSLLEAFRSGLDIHGSTASNIFEKSIGDITSEERKVGKTINFALMYGMGPHGLAQSLSIDLKQAKEYIDRFLGKYPKVAAWKEEHLKTVRQNGYVETLYGRRRALSAMTSGNFHQRSAAERIAINHPLQGTQADLMKMAMIRLDREIRHHHLGNDLKMLLQVHDELVFEVSEDKLETARELIVDEMEGSIELKVPVEVHLGVGDNWQDAK